MSFNREERSSDEPVIRGDSTKTPPVPTETGNAAGGKDDASNQSGADQPPPFPEGLQTSDNFTDETIPYVR